MMLTFLGQRYKTHAFETELEDSSTPEIKAIGKYRGMPIAIPAPRALGVSPSTSVNLAYRCVSYRRSRG